MTQVSVIIPAFNAERFIAQSIASVFAQTYKNFEIIVVDDGSSDTTAEIAKSFDVRLIRKANRGVSSARNTGIEIARGRYIAFLDADDLWEPTKLERQVALLDNNPDIGLCYTGMFRVDKDLKLIGLSEARQYEDYCKALLLSLSIVNGPSTVALRSDIAKRLKGFDESFTNYEDWEFWLRLSLVTKFAPVNENLIKYRVMKSSASHNFGAAERDMQKALNKFFSLPNLPMKYRSLRNQSFSNNWMILAGDYLHAGNYSDSMRCVSNALKLFPRNFTRPLGLPLRLVKRLLSNQE